MEELRYRFRCHDVADCDVVIFSVHRASIVEAVQSHMRDAHGEDLAEDDAAALIETV